MLQQNLHGVDGIGPANMSRRSPRKEVPIRPQTVWRRSPSSGSLGSDLTMVSHKGK